MFQKEKVEEKHIRTDRIAILTINLNVFGLNNHQKQSKNNSEGKFWLYLLWESENDSVECFKFNWLKLMLFRCLKL